MRVARLAVNVTHLTHFVDPPWTQAGGTPTHHSLTQRTGPTEVTCYTVGLYCARNTATHKQEGFRWYFTAGSARRWGVERLYRSPVIVITERFSVVAVAERLSVVNRIPVDVERGESRLERVFPRLCD